MELKLEEEEEWNDAQAWLVERAPDHQQQESEVKFEPQFEEPEPYEHDPRMRFRDHSGGGIQWDPQHKNFGFNDGDRDFHRYLRHNEDRYGRLGPYNNEPPRWVTGEHRGESLAELISRPQRVVREEVRGYGPGHAGPVGRYRPDPLARQPVVNTNTFQFPTRFGGKFARAMSTIATNPATAATGTFG